MVVLLVYGTTEEPVTLILHGNRVQTWFSLADTVLQNPNLQLALTIQEILDPQKTESGR
jgi:hypothetical protein